LRTGTDTKGRLNKVKVVVCASSGPALIKRRELLENLADHGCEVIAAAPFTDSSLDNVLARIHGRFIPAPLNPTGINPFHDLRYFQALTNIFRRESPDVVFCYTHKAVIFGLAAAARAGVRRRVALITGLGFAFIDVIGWKRRVTNFSVRMLYRWALQKASLVFFQNVDDKQLFSSLRLLPKDVKSDIVNGSGINLDIFSPQPIPDGPISFLMLSRLMRDKGLREYARAAAMITARYPGVKCNLAGGVDANPAGIPIEEVLDLQRAGHLIYHGDVPDVRPLLKTTSVYVLPSYREGTARSVLEAMSSGRAIITTDAPGCRQTVIPGVNGFLVPIKDSAALAVCMERFIREPDLATKMGAASRKIAEERYDVRKVNARILSGLGLSN